VTKKKSFTTLKPKVIMEKIKGEMEKGRGRKSVCGFKYNDRKGWLMGE